jgi:hypothetical protein
MLTKKNFPNTQGGQLSFEGQKSIFLTPKGPSPFFGPFFKFGQAIVDALFVQKISKFW